MADDLDQPEQKILAQMKAKGFDTTREQAVGCRLNFPPEEARKTAADLILAGYPSVRLDMFEAPAVIATEYMVVSRARNAASETDVTMVAILVGGGLPPEKVVCAARVGEPGVEERCE